MPCFPNTHFVKPEQSKPLWGVLPPHVYFTPTYWSAVPSTRDAVADAAGDRGIFRVREDDDVRAVVEPDDEEPCAPRTSPARITLLRIVPGETARVPCAQPET